MRASSMLCPGSHRSAGLSKLVLVCGWVCAFFSAASCSYFPFVGGQQISPPASSTPTALLGSFHSFVSVRAGEVHSTQVYTTNTDRRAANSLKIFSSSGIKLGSATPVGDYCLFHLLQPGQSVLLNSCENSHSKAVFSVQTAIAPSPTASSLGAVFAVSTLYLTSSGSVLAVGAELSQTSYAIGANSQEVFILDLASGDETPPVALQDNDATAPVEVFEFRETNFCLVSKSGHKHHIIRKSDLGSAVVGETAFVSRFHNVDDRDELGTLFAFDATSILWSTDLQDFSVKRSLDLGSWGLPNCLMILSNFRYLLTAPLLAAAAGRLLAVKTDELSLPDSLPFGLQRSMLQGSTASSRLNGTHLAIVFAEDSSLGLYFVHLETDPCQARDANDVCKRCPVGLLRDSDRPDNHCVSQSSMVAGQGVRQSDWTILSCQDSDCLECFEDFSRCGRCTAESNKIIFEGRCLRPEELPAGFGADPSSGAARSCEASNCMDCRQNNKLCSACSSGFTLQGQQCEACQVPHCQSCPANPAICSECEESSGFFLESARKCSAADLRLRETAYIFLPATIKIAFSRPFRVVGLAGLMNSTTIRDLQDQRVYRCSPQMCRFSVEEAQSELTISLFPEHLASKPQEALLLIESSPDFSIVSTHRASWVFKDYLITVEHLYLAVSEEGPRALNSLIACLVYFRIPLNALSSLLAPSVSTFVDEAFSFLHFHRFFKGNRLGVVRYFHLSLLFSEAGSLEKSILAFLREPNTQDCYLSLYSMGETSDCLTTIILVRSIVSIIAAGAATAVVSILWWSFRGCVARQARAQDPPSTARPQRRSLTLKLFDLQLRSIDLSSRFFFQRIEGMRLLLLHALLLAIKGLKSSQQKLLVSLFVATISCYYLLFWTASGRLLWRLAKGRKQQAAEKSTNENETVRDRLRRHGIEAGPAAHQFEGIRLNTKMSSALVPSASALRDLWLASLGLLLLEWPTAQSLTVLAGELVYLLSYVCIRSRQSLFEHASESLLLLFRVCLFGIRSADCLYSLDPTQRQTWKGWTTVYLLLTLVVVASSATVAVMTIRVFRFVRPSLPHPRTRVQPRPVSKVKSILRSAARARPTGHWINRIQLHKEYIQISAKRSSQANRPGLPSGDSTANPRVSRADGPASARRRPNPAKPPPTVSQPSGPYA